MDEPRNGCLVIHDGRALALPSRDTSETFVAGALGMTSPEAERRMIEEALGHHEMRNEVAPSLWTGASEETAARRGTARVGYTPEGF